MNDEERELTLELHQAVDIDPAEAQRRQAAQAARIANFARRPKQRSSAPRSEKGWWQVVRDEWLAYRATQKTPRFHLTRVEVKMPLGLPDVLVQDRYFGTTAWIELKARHVAASWPHSRVSLGLSPSQAAWHWHWRRNGGYSGILTWLIGRNCWVWVPGRAWHGWIERVLQPNGWLLVPHIIGTGPVPQPPLLFHLDAEQGAIVHLEEQRSTAHLKELIEWPKEPNVRLGDAPWPSPPDRPSEKPSNSLAP